MILGSHFLLDLNIGAYTESDSSLSNGFDKHLPDHCVLTVDHHQVIRATRCDNVIGPSHRPTRANSGTNWASGRSGGRIKFLSYTLESPISMALPAPPCPPMTADMR